VTAPTIPVTTSLRTSSPNALRRKIANRAGSAAVLLCLLLALAPLAAILAVVFQKGLAAMSIEFLTKTSISVISTGGGWVHGLIGSLYMLAIATVIVVPIGIGASLYLVEFRNERLTTPIRFFTDVMTGVPSIFVGLFVYATLVGALGFGTFVGAVALALLMLPIVVRSSEEILKLVPGDLRRAAYALGARRWQTALRVVLPAAGPGLITGSMLAISRALGETAPLILTAFGAVEIVGRIQGTPQAALTLLIFNGARSPFAAGKAKAWAGALELMLLVLLITFIARLIALRASRSR
jgi:phosphate transport system permease protein